MTARSISNMAIASLLALSTATGAVLVPQTTAYAASITQHSAGVGYNEADGYSYTFVVSNQSNSPLVDLKLTIDGQIQWMGEPAGVITTRSLKSNQLEDFNAAAFINRTVETTLSVTNANDPEAAFIAPGESAWVTITGIKSIDPETTISLTGGFDNLITRNATYQNALTAALASASNDVQREMAAVTALDAVGGEIRGHGTAAAMGEYFGWSTGRNAVATMQSYNETVDASVAAAESTPAQQYTIGEEVNTKITERETAQAALNTEIARAKASARIAAEIAEALSQIPGIDELEGAQAQIEAAKNAAAAAATYAQTAADATEISVAQGAFRAAMAQLENTTQAATTIARLGRDVAKAQRDYAAREDVDKAGAEAAAAIAAQGADYADAAAAIANKAKGLSAFNSIYAMAAIGNASEARGLAKETAVIAANKPSPETETETTPETNDEDQQRQEEEAKAAAELEAAKAAAIARIDSLTELTAAEKQAYKDRINAATTKDEVAKIVAEATELNDSRLAESRTQAKEIIDSLTYLSDAEKDAIKQQIDAASSVETIISIVREAIKANIDKNPNLSAEQKESLKTAADGAADLDSLGAFANSIWGYSTDEDDRNIAETDPLPATTGSSKVGILAIILGVLGLGGGVFTWGYIHDPQFREVVDGAVQNIERALGIRR
ncbi:MAG: GA module-containing protein [Corynebacterium sp.]|nr:GA module-containing protein [Corynebacterium sp.]